MSLCQTPPGTAVAAVYLTLSGGPQADRLVGAATPRAAMTQIHVVSEVDGMARMRPVEGVDVPAHTSVALAPQGTHLMLMNLPQPLVAGRQIEMDERVPHMGADCTRRCERRTPATRGFPRRTSPSGSAPNAAQPRVGSRASPLVRAITNR